MKRFAFILSLALAAVSAVAGNNSHGQDDCGCEHDGGNKPPKGGTQTQTSSQRQDSNSTSAAQSNARSRSSSNSTAAGGTSNASNTSTTNSTGGASHATTGPVTSSNSSAVNSAGGSASSGDSSAVGNGGGGGTGNGFGGTGGQSNSSSLGQGGTGGNATGTGGLSSSVSQGGSGGEGGTGGSAAGGSANASSGASTSSANGNGGNATGGTSNAQGGTSSSQGGSASSGDSSAVGQGGSAQGGVATGTGGTSAANGFGGSGGYASGGTNSANGGFGGGGSGVGTVKTNVSTVTNNNQKTLYVAMPTTPAVAPTIAATGSTVVTSTCGPLQRVESWPIEYLLVNLFSNPDKVQLSGQMTDVLVPVLDKDGKVKTHDVVDNGDGTISHMGTIYSMVIITVSGSTSKQFGLGLVGSSSAGNGSNGVSGTLTLTQRVIVTGGCEWRKFRKEEPAASSVNYTKPAEPVDYPFVDPCANAPTIARQDLYRVGGRETMWRNAGVDPVRGKPLLPFLRELEFSEGEAAIFMQKIADRDGDLKFLQNGDRVGNAMTGSGKMRHNYVVQFNPVPATGAPKPNDNRAFVYTHEEPVKLGGQCVMRRMTLMIANVCGNPSRLSDEITPITPEILMPSGRKE